MRRSLGYRCVQLLLSMIAAASCGACFVSTVSNAATYYWQASNGDWSVPANWGGTAPANYDDAYITNGGTASVTQSGEAIGGLYVGDPSGSSALVITSGSLTANYQAYLGYASGSNGSVALSGSGAMLAGMTYVGYNGAGTFTQSGGSNRPQFLYLGFGSSSSGAYTLGNSAVLNAGPEYIGYGGSGSFTQTGGTNTAGVSGDSFYLGYNSGATGAYSLSGSGTLTTADQYIGNLGVGTFTQFGGVNCVTSSSGPFALGYASSGSGTYNLSGAGSLTAYNQYVGYSGKGTFNQSGGTNSINAGSYSLYVGYNSAAAGSYNLAGGTLAAPTEYIGYQGDGAFSQTLGTNSISSRLYVGYDSGGNGSYTLSGGALSAPYEQVSQGASFSHTGGTNTASNLALSNGTYSLSGSGSLMVSTAESVGGYSAAGTFSQSGGANSCSQLSLYGPTGSNNAYNLISGTVTAAAETIYGGTFNQTGGTNTPGYLQVFSPGTYALSGGSLNVCGGLQLQGGALDLTHSAVAVSISSSIIDLSGGAVNNTENASLALDANSLLIVPSGYDPAAQWANYSNAGILHVAGSALTISSVQAISGTSTISDHVNCEGALRATAGGFIDLNGGLTLSGNGVVDLGSGSLTATDASTIISGGALTAASVNLGGPDSSGSIIAGSVAQSGGVVNAMALNIGPGLYTLTGGTLIAPNEVLGAGATGTFTQSGGVNALSAALGLGYSEEFTITYSGLLHPDGGTWFYPGFGVYILSSGSLSAPAEYLGAGSPYGGTGTFNQSGGTNTISSTTGLVLGCYALTSGTYSLNGGTLITAAMSQGSGTATFNFGGGTLQASGPFTTTLPMTLTGTGGNANVDTHSYAVTLSGLLSGSGGLNKLGAGTLTLTGANGYAGLTTVQAGTLWLGPAAQNPVFSLGGIDIQGGALVLGYSGTSPAATVEAILRAGYQQDFATGSGQIFSSTAAANGLTLGWADNGSNAVTIMATLPGDANLDGRVDVNDLTVVLTNFGTTGAVWSQGDFTYDGTVDVNDLTIVLTNFGQSVAGASPAVSAVPEPSVLLLLSAVVLVLLARAGWTRR